MNITQELFRKGNVKIVLPILYQNLKSSTNLCLLINLVTKQLYIKGCICAKSLRLCCFATLWTITSQAPLSMGFSRQEYWTGLPCSPPGDLSDPGIEPQSPVAPALQGDSLPLSQRGSPSSTIVTLFQLSNASPFSMLK